MNTQTLTIPKVITDYWQPVDAEKKVAEAAVLALLGEKKITISRGAELLDQPLVNFLQLMSNYGLAVIEDGKSELQEDVRTLRQALN